MNEYIWIVLVIYKYDSVFEYWTISLHPFAYALFIHLNCDIYLIYYDSNCEETDHSLSYRAVGSNNKKGG